MLSMITRHSSSLLIASAFAGFMLPNAAAAMFPFLPYILFFLMLFTLLGIDQKTLIKRLATTQVWGFALFHSAGMTLISCSIATLLGSSDTMLLAVAGVAATGSLFATPAIARSIGLDALEAMAMTIATTLLMPAIIYVNLWLFSDDSFALDVHSYAIRLVVFIVSPMLLSACVYRLVPAETLKRVHGKLAHITILLVFAFPFGLIEPFRKIFDQSAFDALQYFGIGLILCGMFFLTGLICYAKQGKQAALLAAITTGNRNVLLTFTIAGTYLGPDFLILLGAIQPTTYAFPLFVRWLAIRLPDTPNPPRNPLQSDNTKQ
ncbi:membrane protein [Photobacterium aquae]|uniref:Membrane protein n=1 Tax=Photobacterium aquae TaxID=1195763 RepID=A0A0J1GV91_9GAMM|nr:hypothetical protein [Photobacterium aquae]KLV03329.1 membrane protein [Photobacterium aquae]